MSDGIAQDGVPGQGKITGYEMAVNCPHCAYPTERREVAKGDTVTCGEDFPENDEFGCGRELEVIVRETE